jgi:hypothetical protein
VASPSSRERPRFTGDIDVVLTIREGEVDSLLALARAHGFADDPDETRMLVEAGLLRLWSPPSRDAGVPIEQAGRLGVLDRFELYFDL